MASRSDSIRRGARIEALIRAQGGPVARAQLIACGLSASAIDSRLSRGALHSLYPGVYTWTAQPLTRRGELAGALLGLPRPGLLSGEVALELWGLGDRAGTIELTVGPGPAVRIEGLRIRRRRVDAADRARRDGLPVTGVERTLIDLSPLGERRLRRGFEEAVRLDLISPESMRAACARARSRTGVGAVRRLLEEWTAPESTRSELERDFLRLCRRHGLPAPRVTARVAGWEVDAWWPAARVAVELDGWAFHGRDRFQFERDRRKGLALAAAGVELIRVGYADVTARGEQTAATIAARVGGSAASSGSDRA